MNFVLRSMAAAIDSPSARSFCSEYKFTPWPTFRCPMRSTSYFSGFVVSLLAGDTVAGVFVAPSGVLEAGDLGVSEAATHCTPTSRQIVKVTRREQWGWEDGWRFSFDPLGDGHPASPDPVVTSATHPAVVKVLSHVCQVLCVAKAGGWSRAGRVRTGWWLATRSASCKGRRCTSSRATHSPQRRALISSSCPTRSQSGRDR